MILMYDELIERLRRCASYDPRFVIQDCEDAADAIEELQKQLQKSEEDNVNLTGWLAEEHAKHLWIPVTERLPEVRTWVLCYCRANSFDVFRMTDEGHWQYGNRSIYMKGYVTHWMPLPQPPKK